MDVGWVWGGCGVDVGWMWGGCRVDVELLSSFCVKSVQHKGQKRKLLLAENGTVYKVKRSKMENNVEAGQYVQIPFICVTFLRNKLFQTLICVLIYATKETPFQQYFALKMYTFSRSPYPFFRPFEVTGQAKAVKRQ